MTAASKSTAVATTGVGNLPAEARRAIEARKMANAVAAEIAKLSWGQSLDVRTARAIADWGARFRVDVTVEIDVLGNRVYLNARYYLRRLAELVDRGVVEYAYADHIEADPRLDAMAKAGDTEAVAEVRRRAMARIEHQVPDKAKSAVVFRVKIKAMAREVTGAKWCGNSDKKDPVGEAFPVETSESRAARRCMRQIAGHVPDVAGEIEAVEIAAEAEIEPEIQRSHVELAAALESHPRGLKPVSAAGYDADLQLDAELADDE